MGYALAFGIVTIIVQACLFWWLARQVREAARVGTRIDTLREALSLLAETTEAGFAALVKELDRLADTRQPGVPPRGSRRGGMEPGSSARVAAGVRKAARRSRKYDAVTSRLVAATRRGKSLPDIAAAERISEGEARLRLALAEELPTS